MLQHCVITVFFNLSLGNFPSLIKRLRTVTWHCLHHLNYLLVSVQLFDVSHYWILFWPLALIRTMAANHVTSWCSIVPEDLLYTTAEDDEASPKLREVIQNTLNEGRDLFKKSVISNNINGIINGKSIPVTFNGKPPPATAFECFLWSANRQDDLPGKAYHESILEQVLERIYHFFQQAYNWTLFNNNGNQLHVTYSYGPECLNAYWNGSQVILGSGTQRVLVTKNTMRPLHGATISFRGCWDVLAHELTHGIISQTSGLHYHDEPGALSEHLADVFGVLYKQYEAESRGYRVNAWTIGEAVYSAVEAPDFDSEFERPPSPERYPIPIVPARRANATYLEDKKRHSVAPFLRTLANPSLTIPPQAIRYPRPPRKLVRLPYDKGGVHHYSGIPSLAFYTAAMDSGGQPWRGVGQVWFRAMVDPRLRPDSNFPHFAALTIDWAEKQYPELKYAIINGWRTVEVEPLLLAESV